MSELLVVLGLVGLTWIVTNSYLLVRVRHHIGAIHPYAHKLVNCSQCVGFWVGLVGGALTYRDARALLVAGAVSGLAGLTISTSE